MFGRLGPLEILVILLLPLVAVGIVGIGMLITRSNNRNKRPPGQY